MGESARYQERGCTGDRHVKPSHLAKVGEYTIFWRKILLCMAYRAVATTAMWWFDVTIASFCGARRLRCREESHVINVAQHVQMRSADMRCSYSADPSTCVMGTRIGCCLAIVPCIVTVCQGCTRRFRQAGACMGATCDIIKATKVRC